MQWLALALALAAIVLMLCLVIIGGFVCEAVSDHYNDQAP